MEKVYAKKDITYPNEDKKPVVMWKKGQSIDNENIANILISGSPDLVSKEKPELREKEKNALEKVKDVVESAVGKKK